MIDGLLYKSIFKGLVSFIPGYKIFSSKKKTKHSSSNSEFCYNFWLGLLIYLDENKINCDFSDIIEIGSGNSIGIGYCALLTKTKKYTSYDIKKFDDKIFNIDLFEEILLLFSQKKDIFIDEKLINIRIKSNKFPEHLIDYNFLTEKNVSFLRKQILSKEIGKSISLKNNIDQDQSIKYTFAFSRAVMEHVKNPDLLYYKVNEILYSQSVFINDIEFHSHGITKEIDGHLRINKFLWWLIYGKRDYFLNRVIYNEHKCLLEKNNFIFINAIENFQYNDKRKESVLYGALVISKKN